MGGKRGKAKAKAKRRGGGGAPRCVPSDAAPRNFVSEAGNGCHIAHGDAPWVVDVDVFDPDDFEDGATLPDLGIDEDGRLTAVNVSDAPRSFFISTPHVCVGAGGRPLTRGWTRDDAGVVTPCTTLVVVAAPKTLLSVAYVQVPPGEELCLDSDVQELTRHAAPESFDPAHTYAFPLGGAGPYLCTQGADGAFTHFFAGTHHAVDFRCPIGTPVLSISAGRVSEVRMSNTCGGVHVRNLFKWNSVMVKHTDGTFAEYVHLKHGSARVAVGDDVAEGVHLADSGDVGFAPEPHLHLQLARSAATDAPTLRFALRDAAGAPYEPQAGRFYSRAGPEPAPAEDD